MTGEAAPVEKAPQTLTCETPVGERTDMVFRGTAVVLGTGQAVLVATGMDTEVG